MATLDMWAWYGQGLIPQNGAADLDGSLNGVEFTAGVDFDYYNYGDLQMVDADGNDVIRDADVDDGTVHGGDGIITPDGVQRQLNEVALYENTVITYLDFNGTEQTWTMTLTVWQLGNGDAVLRINESINAQWPADFYPGNITSITVGTWDGVEYGSGSVSANDDQAVVVCFTSGTQFKTLYGEVMIEDIQVGDMILTLDHGYQPVRWIGSRTLSATELGTSPNLRPISIRAGALGYALPEQDLIVSPQHRVLVRSQVAERMFGTKEVLVAAKHLVALDGIEVAANMTEVTYWHFLFDQHQIVFSNGAATESLFTGAEALKAVSPEAREEIFTIFPGLRADPEAGTAAVRLLVPGRRARKLAERIKCNGKLLVA
ncbi:Hint domain-containing protein [Celeribacter baekdonensis]|uniref:Hint domain-containing protein n=1 Tax=Celeribacter baekdonensis TaxID=875171 RepID=UPI001E4EA159|nr:Hint domain-containing protein [Celeribacter baekdonensis]